MALAETAQLAVNLNLKGDFKKGLGQAQTQLGTFGKGVKGATGAVGGMDKAATGLGGRLKGIIRDPQLKSSILTGVGLGGGLVGFQLLAGGISKAVDVLGDAVRMAAEEEAAMAQLTQAIKENDEAWDGNIDAVEALITKRQQLAFSDGEQRESLQLLVGATKDVTKAQDLLGTAMDFARFRGIALKTSADLLGRAYAGNFGTLSRYGVVLRKGATATDALTQIQKLAAGQASSYANTTQGKLVRSQIALDDAMEDLGRTMTPVAGALAEMAADTIPQLAEGFATVREELQPLFEMLAPASSRMDDWSDKAREAGQAAGLSSDEIQKLQEDLLLLDRSMAAYVEGVKESSSETERNAALQAVLDQRVKAGTQTMLKGADAAVVLAGSQARAAVAAYRLRAATLDMAKATGIAVSGFKAEKDELQKLIRRANKLGGTRDNTAQRLRRLVAQEERLRARQARAAEKGNARQVAAIQLAIDKNKDMQSELQATLGLLRTVSRRPFVIDIKARALGISVGDLAASIIGGQAAGGPFQAGRAYIVGEKGPELRVERKSGYTYTADQTARMLDGGPMTVNVQPRITVEVSATQVARSIAKTYRTNRLRHG